jgi:acyl-CoA thioesterase
MPRAPRNPALTLVRRDRFAAAIGVKLLEAREGYARARLRLGPDHLNGVGVGQGGALFTLADTAFAAASNSGGQVAVALDASITFARAALPGTLIAEAREEARSRRTSVCTVRITDAAGALVALFRGTAYRKEEAVASLLSGQGTPTPPESPRARPRRASPARPAAKRR